MDALLKEAKGLKAMGDYEGAVALYGQIFSDTCDSWISFEYAQCLKKLERIDSALDISQALYFRDPGFEYNKLLLAWLFYEKHFRLFKDTYSSTEMMVLYETAIFVTQLVKQDDRSPYEIVLLRLIKLMKRSTVNKEDQLLTLLALLDFDKLSEVPRKTVRKDKELVFQSDKEMVYGSKTKALFKKKKYLDCITCCDEALAKIKSFHHNNDLWIQFRKALCIGKVEGDDSAISQLERLLEQKTHWVLFVELGKRYQEQGDSETALYYYCRAAVTSDPPKMKVKLFYDMWQLLEQMDDKIQGALHARYVKTIRAQSGWEPHRRIEAYLDQRENKDDFIGSIQKQLNTFWIRTIYDRLGIHFGTINGDYQPGKSGYVETDNQKILFRMASISNFYKPKAKDRVQFCKMDIYDQRKNKKTIEATFLTLDFSSPE